MMNRKTQNQWQVTFTHLCCWENRIPKARLAVTFKNNTAKLLQLNRITNVDGRYSI